MTLHLAHGLASSTGPTQSKAAAVGSPMSVSSSWSSKLGELGSVAVGTTVAVGVWIRLMESFGPPELTGGVSVIKTMNHRNTRGHNGGGWGWAKRRRTHGRFVLCTASLVDLQALRETNNAAICALSCSDVIGVRLLPLCV